MKDQFLKNKRDILNKNDKSAIGKIDKKISDLCQEINKRDDAFTLSSCSGRICLLEVCGQNKKKQSKWLTVTHDLANSDPFWKALENYKGDNVVYFKQEGAILHICLENLELAQKFIELGKISGFNKCGIITSKKKIIVELICGVNLENPIYDKKVLISIDYLNYLISCANNRQVNSWTCINKIHQELKNLNL